MNYEVEWLADAEDALADAWLHAADPRGVTLAQAQIDRLLARDPLGYGQPIHEGLYKITISPLPAFYAVSETPRQVVVSQVWYRA